MTNSSVPFSNVTVSRYALLRNAAPPILLTLPGILNVPFTMPVSSCLPNAAPSKAAFPIVSSPSFRLTSSNPEQPENAPSPIVFKDAGIAAPCRLLHPLNAQLPIVSRTALSDPNSASSRLLHPSNVF